MHQVEEINKVKEKKEMSSLSEYAKKLKNKNNDFYFGEGNWKQETNKYVSYKSVIDNDNVIIRTNNIEKCRDSYILIVGKNKAIFLKNWQIQKASNFYKYFEGYVVKLNREYYKTYTFKNEFEDYGIENDYSFDDMVELGKLQENQMTIKI